MTFTVVIPARYQSSRLPGKALLPIAGKPMVQHVAERAAASKASAVYVATDDPRIERACREAGINVCMTASNHTTGTDRIEEACRQIGLADDDVVINIQGDEPLIPPAVINQLAEDIDANPEAGICSLYEHIEDAATVKDPHVVKVVTGDDGMALYFSRAEIPYPGHGFENTGKRLYKRHIGIYAYRVSVLKAFVNWPVHILEETERLEQLRALANGVRIHMSECREAVPAGVDTESDLDKVRARLERSDNTITG